MPGRAPERSTDQANEATPRPRYRAGGVREELELVRESLRGMSEAGFAAVAEVLGDDFTMDSPHGIEAVRRTAEPVVAAA